MKYLAAFATRFSKAIGSIGGGGLGLLASLALKHYGVTLPPEAVPLTGAFLGTLLAPPNS